MLKFLAILFMTLDHIGVYFSYALPTRLYISLRILGRIAFPLFAYNTALSYRRTRSFFRYTVRLFLFASFSQVIINYAKSLAYQNPFNNVIFTMALGVVFITAYELFQKGNYDRLVKMKAIHEGPQGKSDPWQFRFNLSFEMETWLAKLLGLLFMGLSLFAAAYFETDYAVYGVLMIFLFHLSLNQEDQDRPIYTLALISSLNLAFISLSGISAYFSFLDSIFSMSTLQGFSILAVPVIFLAEKSKRVSDKRPPAWQKYFFYLYYPLHILVLAWLARNLIY